VRARRESKGTLRWGAVVLVVVLACVPFAALAQCEASYLEINNALERGLMPNLRGCTWEEGRGFILRLHKVASSVEGHSELGVGVVYDQSPVPSTQVTPEMEVELRVSTGPEPAPLPQAPEPPQPPPPPQGTDVAVVAQAGSSGVAVGKQDRFDFVVTNAGPSRAIVTIVFRGTNFFFDAASRNACPGDDHSTTCSVGLESGRATVFGVVGSPEVEGEYRVSASLEVGNTSDTNSDNNASDAVPRHTPAVGPSSEEGTTEEGTTEEGTTEEGTTEEGTTEAPPGERSTDVPATATLAVPPSVNTSIAAVPIGEDDVVVTVRSLDEQWVLGRNLRFQVSIWNRGKRELRNVALRIGERSNLGRHVWLGQGCAEDRCTINVLPAGETAIFPGAFTTPSTGEARATFPVTWRVGRATQSTQAQLAGMVGQPGWPSWVWIAICVGVLTLAWIAKVVPWPPVPPNGGSTPRPGPPSLPTVRVNPIGADIVDASPTSGIPLTAPPLRINVVVAFGDALVHGDLPVWKKES
jgi:hypothetical protein